jgi:hypothetical protein
MTTALGRLTYGHFIGHVTNAVTHRPVSQWHISLLVHVCECILH